MIQEYLLLDDSEKEAIEHYKPEGVETIFVSVDNGKCCYVRFSHKANNEDAAKVLSEVNDYIRNNFQVTVLANESSAYMNKRLYPYINHFEHSLRKLLYLKSAINSNKNENKTIHDLESQDFGQIFTLLFIDNSFMTTIKEKVKNQNRDVFSKDQILAIINSVDENTLWDSLLGKDSVPTLRSSFNDVRHYRNDVMHSHYISWEQYKNMEKLFRTINRELDTSIAGICGTEVPSSDSVSFNQALQNAIQAQDELYENIEEAYGSLRHIDYDRIYSNASLLSKSVERLISLYESNDQKKKIKELIDWLSSFSKESGLPSTQGVEKTVVDNPKT